MATIFDDCFNRANDILEDYEKRNKVASIISGTFFFIGWWIIIDISCQYTSANFSNAYHVCGVLATVSMFMINCVSNQPFEMYQYGATNYPIHIWLFIGFVLGFVSLIASIWILIAVYIIPGENVFPGLGVFFQNFFIFLGSMIFKFGRKEEFSGI